MSVRPVAFFELMPHVILAAHVVTAKLTVNALHGN
jgi:hypothetical protein